MDFSWSDEQLEYRATVEKFTNTCPRSARRVFWQRVQRKEPMGNDFLVRLRRRALVERTHDVKRDMVAARDAAIELNSEQNRLIAEFNIAFFA